MNQAQAQAELSTLLGDTLAQISSDRLTQAVTQAWRDQWVARAIFDTTSLTYTAGTYQYTVPSTMTTVDAIYIQRSTSIPPEEIASELWEVVGGNILFSSKSSQVIPSGYALQVRGKYKLTSTDSILTSNQALQNYVVNLAALIVLRQLGFSRVMAFLKNDTSMSELVAFRNMVEQDVLRYKAQLTNSFVNG